MLVGGSSVNTKPLEGSWVIIKDLEGSSVICRIVYKSVAW